MPPSIPTLIYWALGLGGWPTLVLGVACLASKRTRQPLVEQWHVSLARFPLAMLMSLSLFYGALWAWTSLRRHAAFESGSFDLGIFTNAIWSLTHGYGYQSSLKGMPSLFADHQSPIFWAVAPIFALFPHPETLLIIQALALAAGAGACYVLANQYLGYEHWAPPFGPLLYLAYVPLRYANTYDFHPEVLMLPLFLWGIAGIQGDSRRARLLGAVALLAALGAKESAGPVAAGIGLAWVLGAAPEHCRQWCRRVGIALSILGVAVFAIDLRIPRLWGVTYPYLEAYDFSPSTLISRLFAPGRAYFLFRTLAPFAFLPLLNPRAAVAALPGYLMLFLSAGEHRLNLHYHYAIEPAVGLFWAVWGGLANLRQLGYARLAPVALLVCAALSSFPGEWGRALSFGANAHDRWLATHFIPSVPAGATVAASDGLISHLATRPVVFKLDKLADCIIYDSAVENWPWSMAEQEARLRELQNAGYHETFTCQSTRVFSRGACSISAPCSP